MTDTLSGKDLTEYMRGMVMASRDPVWFATHILGFERLYPIQEEILRTFYRHKYNPNARQMRNFYAAAGQRCLCGNTLITTDIGLIKLEDLVFSRASKVFNGRFMVPFDEVVYAGQKQKWVLTTRYGYKLECSGDHKVWCNGDWVRVSDIKPGDTIAWNRRIGGTPQSTEFPDHIKDAIRGIYYKGTKPCTFPIRMTPELAEFIGYIIADGTIGRENRCEFTKENPDTLARYTYLVNTLFHCDMGQNAKAVSKAKTITILHSQVCKFVHALGVGCWNSHTKQIPDIILQAPFEIRCAFLRGYFDGDGSAYLAKSGNVQKPIVTTTTVSEQLAYQIQQMLREMGIVAGMSIGKSVEYNSRDKRENNAYTVRIYGLNIIQFATDIGFTTPYKQEGLLRCCEYLHTSKSVDIPEFYLPVKSVECTDEFVDMYDLHVPDGNCYYANGFLVHNSGKTMIASIMMCYEFFDVARLPEPQRHYGIHAKQELFLTAMATSGQLAEDGIFANMRNTMEDNEWLNQWFDLKFKNDRIDYNEKHIHAQVLGSWINTAVGRTNKFVVLDEIDYFEETTSKRGGWEIYSRMNKSRDTLGDEGHLVAISSPKSNAGIIMTLAKTAMRLARDQGIENVDSLGMIRPTWEMNPNPEFSFESLKIKYAHDLATMYRDYGCQPELAGGLQFPEGIRTDRTLVNVLKNRNVRPDTRYTRVMSIDPAVKNDKFGISTAYKVPFGGIVVDGTYSFRKLEGDPYIMPSDVWAFIEEAIPRCNVSAFVFDAWMFPEIIERVQKKFGITAEKHIVTKEDYDRWRDLMMDGIENPIRVVHDDELVEEADELVVKDGVKPKVEHLFNKSKDLSDTVANCVWYLSNFELECMTPPIVRVRII